MSIVSGSTEGVGLYMIGLLLDPLMVWFNEMENLGSLAR